MPGDISPRGPSRTPLSLSRPPLRPCRFSSPRPMKRGRQHSVCSWFGYTIICLMIHTCYSLPSAQHRIAFQFNTSTPGMTAPAPLPYCALQAAKRPAGARRPPRLPGRKGICVRAYGKADSQPSSEAPARAPRHGQGDELPKSAHRS